MKLRWLLPILASLVASSARAAPQGGASFQVIPAPSGAILSPTAISPDGLYVVGLATFGEEIRPFRWRRDNGLMTVLNHPVGANERSFANGVANAAYGGSVVGSSLTSTAVACTWDVGGTAQIQPQPCEAALLADISSNNFISVGHTVCQGQSYAVVWHPDFASPSTTWWSYLDTTPSVARAIAPFANVAVGMRQAGTVWKACRWELASSYATLLDGPTSPFSASEAKRTSTDGSTTVGWGNASGLWRAALWKDGAATILVDGSGATFPLWASGVSGSGKRVVGTASFQGSTTAFIWEAQPGARELELVLAGDHGLVLPSWHLLDAADISGNGRWVTGRAVDPQGETQGYLAYLPGPCAADLTGDGLVNLHDIGPFSAALNNNQAPADLDGDGVVNLQDVSLMSMALQGRCP